MIQELAPWSLGLHTSPCNCTHVYTHSVLQVSRKQTRTYTHSLKFAQVLGVTHTAVCIHTGHLTHSSSCNTRLVPHPHNTPTHVHTHRLWLDTSRCVSSPEVREWHLESPAHWQPAGPFLMQMTPGSLRWDWGPAPSERNGWGQGTAHAHTHLYC